MTRGRGVRRALGALAAVAALTLAACAPIPDEGEVLAKDYSPAYSTIITICSGNPIVCRPIPQYHPERWSLLISDDDDGTWVRVDAGTWQSLEVGDWWVNPNP